MNWVSVEERLPEDGEYVVWAEVSRQLMDGDFYADEIWFAVELSDGEWAWPLDKSFTFTVTHWLEITPPKTDNELREERTAAVMRDLGAME